MRGFLIVALAALMCACSSNRKVVSNPPVVVTNTDSVATVYIETVRIDTVRVEVPIPAEAVKQVVCDSASHVETSLAFSDAWINPDGSLGHTIYNKEGKLSADVPVMAKDTRSSESAERIREVPVPYPEPVEVERDFTRWESFMLNTYWYLAGILVLSLCLVYLGFRKR